MSIDLVLLQTGQISAVIRQDGIHFHVLVLEKWIRQGNCCETTSARVAAAPNMPSTRGGLQAVLNVFGWMSDEDITPHPRGLHKKPSQMKG